MTREVHAEKGRLLFVVNVAWFFISHRLPIAVAAREAGYDVHVAAGGALPEELELLREAGLTFHALDLQRSARGPMKNFILLRQLRKLYLTLRPDIIHHVTVKPVMLGTFAARAVPEAAVVNAISGLGYTFAAVSVARRLLRRAIGVGYRFCLSRPKMTLIFQNSDDREEFGRWTNIDISQSVLITGSGVDLNRFVPRIEPSPPITVVLPARMLHDKGVCEFASAIGELRREGLEIEGLLAGGLDPDNPANMSETEIRALEREHGVRWLGHCSDMPALYSSAHIVCLPSYREGLPKALIEAAAAGRALITADVPGCRQVVADGVTGLLVPAARVQELKEALRKLSTDHELRAKLGSAARANAEHNFGVDRVVEQTLYTYARSRS